MDDSNNPVGAREIYVPGDIIEAGDLKAGQNVYREGSQLLVSKIGVKTIRSGYLNIVPMSGKYIPHASDNVIGIVADIGPSSWFVDINSPYLAPLHVNDVPWRVEFGDTARFIRVGDTLLMKIVSVDETRRVHCSMKEQGLKKLSGGLIVKVDPPKVPRVIGKGGSMIQLIKRHTNCRMFVGQNGRIWLEGDAGNVAIAIKAIDKIEREAHTVGLTDALDAYLGKEMAALSGPAGIEEKGTHGGDVNEG